MGLTRYQLLDEDGEVTGIGDFRGSCTGAFLYNPTHRGSCHVRPMHKVLKQAFEGMGNFSQNTHQKVAGSALVQALVPGCSFQRSELSGNRFYVFPGIDTLPSDQVITALRLIKVFCDGRYSQALNDMREFEFPFDYQLVLAAFDSYISYSDYQPHVAGALNSELLSQNVSSSSYGAGRLIRDAYKRPTFAMVHELCKGNINPGWMKPLSVGYTKGSHYEMAAIGQRDYIRAVEHCPIPVDRDVFLTVNHPIIVRVENDDSPEFRPEESTGHSHWRKEVLYPWFETKLNEVTNS